MNNLTTEQNVWLSAWIAIAEAKGDLYDCSRGAESCLRMFKETFPNTKHQWQPIETAPKTGKKILLKWTGFTEASLGSWEDYENRQGWKCVDDDCVPKNQHDCTHWLPLPELPD